MNQDEILLLLDPQMRECEECLRHFHSTKTEMLLLKISHNPNDGRCAICGWGESYFYGKMRTANISFLELEAAYGNVFKIKYNESVNDAVFIFTRKDQCE